MISETLRVPEIGEPPPVPVRRFSVAEYHRLIEMGLFAADERCELLEGWIVPKMTRKPAHDVCIELTSEALRGVLPPGWRLRLQSAVTLEGSEPEPDLAVVSGRPRDHLDRHPGPGELALVVEVADVSLAQDRGLKARVYARAGIPTYWIVDLNNRRIEVFTDPSGPAANPASYRSRRIVGEGESLTLAVGDQQVGPIAVGELLP